MRRAATEDPPHPLGPALAGGAVGLGLAVALHLALPPTGDVELARARGIWSATVRASYDDGQEARFWLIAVVLVGAGSFLLGRAGRRSTLVSAVGNGAGPPGRSPIADRAAMGLGLLALLYGWAQSLSPRAASWWGSFGLLGEEGVVLGALEAMRHGRVPWVDLHVPYGPLLLDWGRFAQVALGESVFSMRLAAALAHGLGILALAALSVLLSGGRGPALGLATGSAAALWPFLVPTLNGAAIRPVLALAPAILLPRWPLLAGATAGLAAGWSPELALPAILGLAVAAITPGPSSSPTPRLHRAGVGLVLGLLALAVAVAEISSPVAWWTATLADVSNNVLGFQALPWPDPFGLFVDAGGRRGTTEPGSWVEGLWATVPALVVLLSIALAVGSRSPPALGAVVAAAVLYRAPLGRSDLSHLWTGGVPALVVIAPWVLTRLTRGRAGSMVFAPALILAGTAPWRAFQFPVEYELALAERVGLADPLEAIEVDAARAGIEALPRAGRAIDSAVARIATLPPTDSIWFWPNEALLYHLCERPMPWPYLWAWDAATPEMEARGLAELQAAPPAWVLRMDEQAPFDEVPLNEALPRASAFVEAHYRLAEAGPGWSLLRRTAP